MHHIFLAGFLLVSLSLHINAEDSASDAQPVSDSQPASAWAPKPYLGIALDSGATSFEGQGLVVLRVEPGSPAAVMGIAAGDCLLELDQKPLTNEQVFSDLMRGKTIGDEITIAANRLMGEKQYKAFTCTGILQGLPRTRSASLGLQLEQAQKRLAALEAKNTEPNLAELLQRLHDIEKEIPKAAAAFKRTYPDGEFRMVVSFELTSHKTAAEPLTIDLGTPASEPSASAK